MKIKKFAALLKVSVQSMLLSSTNARRGSDRASSRMELDTALRDFPTLAAACS